MSAQSEHFPQEFGPALSNPETIPPKRALIIVTDSRPVPESRTYSFPSVGDALGQFDRLQHESRYRNRDMYRAEPDGVHFHNILVLDTENPQDPKPVVRSARVVSPNGEWTDTVAHLWVTEGEPHWITTRGDYKDETQPVVNYQFT